MKKGRLIVMRHGESVYNVKKQMTGHTNVPLTKEGVEQGKRVGWVLRNFKIDVAYTSPLDRARQTLELGLDTANCHENLRNKDGSWDLRERFDLIEKDVGDFAGRNFKTCPEVLNYGRKYEQRLPNGESDKDVVDRVQKLYEDEIKPLLDEGKTVVISCHSVVKRAFHVILGEIDGDKLYHIKMPNAQPWIIDFENGVKTSSKYHNPIDYAANDNKRAPKKAPKFKK